MNYARLFVVFVFSVFLIGFAAGGVTVYVVTNHNTSACKCGSHCSCFGGKK